MCLGGPGATPDFDHISFFSLLIFFPFSSTSWKRPQEVSALSEIPSFPLSSARFLISKSIDSESESFFEIQAAALLLSGGDDSVFVADEDLRSDLSEQTSQILKIVHDDEGLDGEQCLSSVPTTTVTASSFKEMASHFALSVFSATRDSERLAYAPVMSPSSTELGFERSSRFFGRPWLPFDFDWPMAKGEPMLFFVQFDLSCCPPMEGLPNKGLMSVFLAPFWDDVDGCCVEVFDEDQQGNLRDCGSSLAPVVVADWVSFSDSLSCEDFDKALSWGVDTVAFLNEFHNSTTVGVLWGWDGLPVDDDQALRTCVKTRPHCFVCDKIGGHPAWIQGSEYPVDSNGNPMVLVFQFSQERPWPLSPDCEVEGVDNPLWGRLFLFSSPDTGEWAYAWQG